MIAGFSIDSLVSTQFGFVIRVHSEGLSWFSTRDTQFCDFSSMLCVCRNSLFNMKNYTPKTPMNGIEICLILSASNNYVGLNTFICPLSIYHHLCNNFYSKVIVLSSFNNKIGARWWKYVFLRFWQLFCTNRALHSPMKTWK